MGRDLLVSEDKNGKQRDEEGEEPGAKDHSATSSARDNGFVLHGSGYCHIPAEDMSIETWIVCCYCKYLSRAFTDIRI